MRYKNQNDLTKRPSFTYLIKFSTSTTNTAIIDTAVYGTGRDCDQYGVNYPPNSHTLLPFMITNITTGKKVNLEHKDSGINYGSIEFGELNTYESTQLDLGFTNHL